MPSPRKPRKPVGGAVETPLVAPEETPEPEQTDELDAIDSILAEIDDPSGHQVCVSEVVNGEREQLVCSGISDFDVWKFGQQFGGGTYELRIREIDTKRYVKQRRFKVSSRVPRPTNAAATPAVAPGAVYTGDRTIDLMLAMMKQSSDQAAQSAQQQTQLLTALINRPQVDNGLKFTDVIQAATLMAGKGGGGGVTEMIDAYQKLQELSGGGSSGGGDSDEVGMAKAFAPVLAELLKKSGEGASKPAAPAQTPPRMVAIRRPRAQLPSRGQGTPPGVAGVATPAADPHTDPEAAASINGTNPSSSIDAAPMGPHEITPEENTLRALAAIVLTALMFPDGTDLGQRVATSMDPQALGALLDEIPDNELGAQILRVAPPDVRPMVDRPDVHQVLAALEAFLRSEITDADDDDGGDDQGGELDAPTLGEPAP